MTVVIKLNTAYDMWFPSVAPCAYLLGVFTLVYFIIGPYILYVRNPQGLRKYPNFHPPSVVGDVAARDDVFDSGRDACEGGKEAAYGCVE
ncbi:hypothetical protein HFD88_009329 [Aspergillus terreus]|nr:hypothetical protein HFD88_009329 [Aspergillus terreus]